MKKKKKKEFRFFWETPFEQPLKDFFEPFEFRFTIPRVKFPKMDTAPVHVGETDKKIMVRAELPGFKKDEISLNVTENTIEIRAAKKQEKISRTEKTFRQEMTAKKFSRLFTLPEKVDPDKTEENLEDGILIVEMEKQYPGIKKKKKVEIK